MTVPSARPCIGIGRMGSPMPRTARDRRVSHVARGHGMAGSAAINRLYAAQD